MADEAIETPAPEAPDTPEPEAAEAPESPEPADTPAEQSVDYEKRYNDLRPEFDRYHNLVAALEGKHGPDAQRQAYQQFGLDLVEDDEDEDEFPDPDERIEKLEKRIAEREEREEMARLEALEQQYLEDELGKIAKSEDRDLSEQEVDLIVSYALSNRHEDGRPDTEGGHKALQAIYTNAQERLVGPKKRAPKPSKGTAGVEKIDTSTDEGTRKALVAAIEESRAASE